jgi:hypothetical protein
MTKLRTDAIVEEIGEVADLRELKALWCFGQSEDNEYGDARFVPNFKTAVARLRQAAPVEQKEIAVDTTTVGMTVEERIADLVAQLAALRIGGAAKLPAKSSPTPRGGRKYVLLKTDVQWSTKPQVHALMDIIVAHANVGETMDEADIVAWCVANEHVLNTCQGGKRIWDYYKGDHVEGLVAHGNIKKV